MLEVTAKLDPLGTDLVHYQFEPGRTVVEIIDELAVRTETPIGHFAYAAVMIEDVKVPFEHWPLVRPKDEASLLVIVLPGDDFGSLFVTLAGFALAAWIPPLGSLTLGGLNVGQFVVRAAISLGTMLISQAIAPSPSQSLSNQRNDPTPASYSISGVRNQARPYDPVPVILGRVTRFHPPYAALPYTETWGGDTQYLRMLFCTEGPVRFSNFKFGDTPVGNLKNFAYETREGHSTDSAITLFPIQVREDAVSVELKQINGYTYRTTQADTDEVSIEIVFPNGMGRVTDRNVKFGINVQFRVVYFGPGLSSYVGAPLRSDIGGGVTFLGDGIFQISGYSKAAVRRAVRFSLPTRGQYSIGVARITVDDQSDNVGKNQSTTFEISFLSTIRSIRNQAPINRTGLAYFAARAQANEQFNGTVDTLNCTAQGLHEIWNGSAWSAPTATRNPAWCYVHVLKRFARALTDDRIDLDTISQWAALCDAQGITFDAELSSAIDVWQLLGDIAATGFASPHVVNDKYSVIIDWLRDEPAQYFSARTISNFQVQKLFAEFPHVVKVRFPNEAAEGQVDEIKYYDTGYNESNATIEEVLDLPYTRSAAIAYRAARRYMVTARLRPRVISFRTNINGIVCRRGSLIRVQHPTALVGTGGARVRSLTFDESSNLTHVELDAPMTTDAALTYEMRTVSSDGTALLLTVLVTGGLETVFELETPIPFGDDRPSVGDHVLFGPQNLSTIDLLVRSMEWAEDFNVTITCVDYSPEIYTSISGPIPEFDPGITLPPVVSRKAPPRPIVISVDSDEDALTRLADGTIIPRVLIAYELRQQSDELTATRVAIRWRRYDSAEDPEYRYMPPTAGIASIFPIEEGQRYLIELRSESEFGATSEWNPIDHTVIGASAPPPTVETLYRRRNLITWPYEDPPIDLWGFYVRSHYGTLGDLSTARLLTPVPISTLEFDISEFDGTNTFFVTAVDVRGNESTEAARLTINLGDPFIENLFDTQAEHPTWSGTITNGSVSGGNLVADSDTLFWPPDHNVFWLSDGSTFWPTDVYKTMTYVARYEPTSDHVGAMLKLELDVLAGVYSVEFRTATSPTFWGLDASTFWGTDTDEFWADELLGAWNSWPGALGPIASTAEQYEFRLTVGGGFTQGDVNEFSIIVDIADETESFEDLAIDAAGTRLPITKAYRSIKRVVIDAVQDDGGTAVNCLVLDKDETLGPLVKTINGSKTGVDGVIDATIIGVKA